MTTRTVFACTFLAAGSLLLFGCGKHEGASQQVSTAKAPAPDAPPDVVVTPEMAAMLAKADALDGQSDKTVSLCASCALKMGGSREHSLKVGEYTMCFCQDSCKGAFSEDIAQHVLAMKLPKADAAAKQ